jgi:hypothetical protein
MSSVASNQVIDVKAKKPRAPKKDKNEPSDSIPPPSNPALETTAVTNATAVTSASETKTKKPRAPKKDKTVDTATSPTNDTNAVESTPAADLDSETDAKTKKPRAPTLPAKFAKFIKFNFFFINQMNDIDQDTKDAYLNTFAVFAPVEQQTQIVTDFLLTQKSVNKDYRSALSAQKKAIAKANKPQRRSKKTVQVDFQNNLVNQLIESANQPTDSTMDAKETKEKKPRGRKPKNDANQPSENTNSDTTAPSDSAKDAKDANLKDANLKDANLKDANLKDAKEKKPRGRKPKQTDTVTAPATLTPTPNVESAANEADQDTEVSRFIHGGKSFLRDRDNNLYDELSHEPVGEYDPNNDSVVLI